MRYILIILIILLNQPGYCHTIKKESHSIRQQQNKKARNAFLYDGIWAVNKNDNAFFIIKGNTVISIDDRKHPFPFQIRHNIMIVNYGSGSLGKYVILKITKDSLVIKNIDRSITRLYKR